MVKKLLIVVFLLAPLTSVNASDLPGNPVCAPPEVQAGIANPGATFPGQIPAPVNRDHTCQHFCRQEYDQCRATCVPGSCWVCFPNYENCLTYNCYS